MRRANAGDDGAMAPTVFRFRTNSLKNAAADISRFAQANTVSNNGREQFSAALRFILMAIVRLSLAAVLACLLVSCGSQHYRITLKDGRTFTAEGEPELQRKTGYYRYENLEGRDALIRADEVLMIEQQ